MWLETERNLVVLDDADYTAPDGTLYPRTFPRNEIPGLTEVPDDEQTIARKAAEAKAAHNKPIYDQLAENDRKVVRAITEGDSARVEAHKAAQAELRSQLII